MPFILEILHEIVFDFLDFLGSSFVAVLMLKYFLLKSLVFLEELFDSSLFVLDLLFKVFDERLLSFSKAFELEIVLAALLGNKILLGQKLVLVFEKFNIFF